MPRDQKSFDLTVSHTPDDSRIAHRGVQNHENQQNEMIQKNSIENHTEETEEPINVFSSNMESTADAPRRNRELYYPRPFLDHVSHCTDANVRKQRAVPENMFEFIEIGNSGWFVHLIIDRDANQNRKNMNLAISKDENRSRFMKNYSIEWIQRTLDQNYKPLVTNDLYVLKILSVTAVSEDEAQVFFLATPVANVSRRLFYQLKVVYPPLEFITQEPLRCLTCPGGAQGDPTTPNEGGYEKSTLGNRPQCIWSDVEMKDMESHYILHCRGPDIPWSSLVSTYNNTVVHQFNEDFRKYVRNKLSSIVHSQRFEFELDLGVGFQIRAELYVPSDWRGKKNACGEKLKMLVQLAEKQDGQMVNAKYMNLLVTTYFTNVLRYAVLFVDVRASKFQILDFLHLKFKRRESMQLSDYSRAAEIVANKFGCIDNGFGAFGEGYGGHLALNLLVATKTFQCAVAVRPSVPWQLYVYPFQEELSEGLVGTLRRQLFKLRILLPLARRLRNNTFAIHTDDPKSPDERYYLDNLVKILRRRRTQFEYDVDAKFTCESDLMALYEWMAYYFSDCFFTQRVNKTNTRKINRTKYL